MVQTIFTTPDVIAHFAAMDAVITRLSSVEALDAGEYSLDAMSAVLCAAAMANKITNDTIKTVTAFNRFTSNCAHIAAAMGLDLPSDKCIHELTAYLFCEIMGSTDPDEAPDYGQAHTIN